ncbi:hypothetical protein [Candidatus Lokiarchaeum ossiferum]|uniref:hypothetical protein n=1 Tax=Candidatus Lokiarchaeum ossiferum TaxID=2951803 RepID=UPI00352FC733
MQNKPWISGPIELLWHGYDHMGKESDFDQRLAMISFDNAVEASLNAFIHFRVPNEKVNWKKYKRVRNSYPGKLELVSDISPQILPEATIKQLTFYHTIRNDMYHRGNGLTVETDKLSAFALLSSRVVQELLQIPVDTLIQEKRDQEHAKASSGHLKFTGQFEKILATGKPIEEFFHNVQLKSKEITEKNIPDLVNQFQDFMGSLVKKDGRPRPKIFKKTRTAKN